MSFLTYIERYDDKSHSYDKKIKAMLLCGQSEDTDAVGQLFSNSSAISNS